MRRIPRPSRAIYPAHPLYLYTCQRASLLHRSQPFGPCTHPQATFAAFSTSSPQSFLLPGGKQDKRKHQQFVRRWQKRLLGDSEPIGAHVDPYDPTSPVRIAPEDQGEYEEVLEEDRAGAEVPSYEPAQRVDRLVRVGGEEWLKQKVEGDMAKEFEKLTLRTYTPLTLDMANEIEELTGTPYTLRDENLMMAQTTHRMTARPYTDHNFGLHRKVTLPAELRSRFTQAISEIYTLEQAGLDLDMSKFANRGVYSPPRWVKDIKIIVADDGALQLIFPSYKSPSLFLQTMQTTPAWETTLISEGEDHLLEEPTVVQEISTSHGESTPTMDPNTPDFKRAAVVKIDGERKPFDFMSNRPVPRSTPSQGPESNSSSDTPDAVQVQSTPVTKSPAELIAAVKASQSTIGELRHLFLEHRSQRLTDNILALRNLTMQGNSGSPAPQAEDGNWRHIRITDDRLRFALFKRLFQLTGIRLPDLQISSVQTLGEMYSFYCIAAKPQPTSLFSKIHQEGAQRARERGKQEHSVPRRRADLGDLISLGNVELRRVKPTKTEKRSKLGLDKVIQYALWERGLSNGKPPKAAHARKRKQFVLEGTRAVPEFGRPVGSAAAEFLSKKTRQLKNQ